MVRRYVGKMDEVVRRHIQLNWICRDNLTVLPFARRLSLDIISSVVFGPEAAAITEALTSDFFMLGDAILSFPLKLPFTRFNKGMSASAKIRETISRIVHKKKKSLLQEGHTDPSVTDFITYMLHRRSQGAHSLSQEDIVDNTIALVIGASGTTSVLITFLMWHLAEEPEILDKVTKEQDEIARNKTPDDALTWDNVAWMKYTWKVAMETLRMIPPILGSFRTATKDIEYQGYHIPQGWKVFMAQSVTHLAEKFFHNPKRLTQVDSRIPHLFLHIVSFHLGEVQECALEMNLRG